MSKGIKIGGITYNINHDKAYLSQHGANGYFHHSTKTIGIDDSLDIDIKRSTMIHEVIEAINYHSELDLKHSIISQLEASLNQFIVDNPHFIQYTGKR